MYFMEDHESDNTAPPIKWETLKCVLKGIFISHGSRLKKNRTAEHLALVKKISDLE